MDGPRQRLGVTLAASRQLDAARMIELAQLAETLDCDSIWVPETWGTDAVSLLTLLARETKRIRLAAGVFNVFSRSAMLIAQTAATLQSLSEGRFVLGLGASGPVVVERWHGVPFRRPVERSRYYVHAIRLALSGSTVDYDTSEFELKGFRLQNPPVTPVPIYIAALGPKNVRLAGAVADGWLPIFAARGHMETLFAELAEGAAQAGRDVAEIDVAAYIPAMVGPRAEVLLRQHIAYYVGGMGTFYAEMLERIGFAADVHRVRNAWRDGDRVSAVRSVSDAILEVCTISGSSGKAMAQLAGFQAERVDLPIVMPAHGASLEEAADVLELLVPHP
jgi:alkanesulfonate monooxygenase SsuD/methylene tetrahydromethanopterin reductase-like flavin-dependent oxidoreductase (luciferase family)